MFPKPSLLRAEWQKVIKNYKLTGFLVWLYPIGLVAFFAMITFATLVSETIQQGMIATGSGQWTTNMLGVWVLVTSFPANILPRMLPLAFMAVVFASEYQWGMWKNLVPRSRRVSLILAKFMILILVVTISIVLCSLVIGIGQVLSHRAAGVAYGPVVTLEVLGDFLRGYAREVLLGMISLFILAEYAALAALLTRSILGGLLAGFGLSVLEPMSFMFLVLIGRLSDKPDIINLYQFTPTYNIENVRSWLVSNLPLTQVDAYFTAEPSLAFSSIVLGVWVIGLITLIISVFERQDIVS
ncbi:MAG: ABC transporter permease [Anaerolineales bacterium]|nr:ABC transporter permease [Anaerolineales bacterium]